MKVTSKGQVTIPQKVREELGIHPAETEIDFVRDSKGKWYIKKSGSRKESRFRTARKAVHPTMSTDELLALTRS